MKKIVFLVIGIILIGFFLSFTHSSAADGETPVDRWIEVTYRIYFGNMTTMNVSATFSVHEIKTEYGVVTADFIRENYDNPLGQGIINGTESEIDHSFNETTNITFRNDDVDPGLTILDVSTIFDVAPGGDEYQPPVNFTKNATITFNKTSFGFNDDPELNLDDVIRGTLKMGAVINKTFQLKADAGYKNTFILIFSDDFKPTSMTDEYPLNTTSVTWTVDNLKAESITNTSNTSKVLTIESKDPLDPFDQNITIHTYINITHFDNRTELGHHGIDVNVTIDIGSINISKYDDMLPNTVSNLTFITPDGIRMVVENNLTTWDEIKNNTVNEAKSNAEETLSNMFNSTMNLVFEWDNASKLGYDVSTMIGDPVVSYMNTTEPAGFSSSSFDLNENASVHNVMIGVLKMGAVVEKEVEMKVSGNTKNIVEFAFPDGVISENPVWEIDNLMNSTEKIEKKTLILHHEEPNIVKEEEILIDMIIDMYDFDELYLYGTIDIKSVNITKYNVSLPSNITNLSYISSDGLRMALENNLVTWGDIENEINNTKKDVEKKISDMFNTTVTLNFTWFNLEWYNLSSMGSDRPINATFVALNKSKSERIEPNLFGDFDAETVTGILNAGAKYSFEIASSEENYTIKMILPTNMIFSDLSIPVKHTTSGNRNAYSWNSSETLFCKLESGIAPEYNESMALLNVLIDMHDVDIFGMMLSIDLNAEVQIYHIELSDVSMPENLTMKYINSDCLRLLYDKDIIKQSDIDNITNELKKALEENLTNALGGNVSISVKIDHDSLTGYDVNNMGNDRPVKISAEAHISISLEQASSNKQAMTLSFLTFPLEFPLSGMEGFNTTYKIILPKGINVLQADDTLGRLEQGTKDGRTYLTITLNETEEDSISITIDATGLILNIILPFIILSVIMTVAGIVVKLMRRKEGKLE